MKRKTDERAELCREFHSVLIVALRHIAFRCWYALAVHGSLRRDIDLIAAPWRDTAVEPAHLFEKIREGTKAIIGIARIREADNHPEKKPCGRLAWSVYLTHDDAGPYIDISILPKGKPD